MFKSILFDFHILNEFSSFLLLISSFFNILWLEDTSYDFSLLKIKTFCGLTYSLVTYSLLWRMVLGSLRKVCFLLLLHEEFCMDVLGAVSLLCCSRLLLLIFCLIFLCITESRILKYSPLIVESFIPSVLSMVASYILDLCYLIHMFINNMFYLIYYFFCDKHTHGIYPLKSVFVLSSW